MNKVDQVINELNSGKIVATGFEGDSMMPMLRQGRDSVLISKPTNPLIVGDVVLYKRLDHLTLHRIIKIKKNGKLIIRGDNRFTNEKDISINDVVGVMVGAIRDGKTYDAGELFGYMELANKKYFKRKIVGTIRLIVDKIKRKIGLK